MVIVLAGLTAGIVAGYFTPDINVSLTPFVGVGLLAAFDSVFGAFCASIKKEFDLSIFITGFFGNIVLAVLLTYIGERLSLDLYLAAVFVFGSRLFNNLADIRRYVLTIRRKKLKMNKVDEA